MSSQDTNKNIPKLIKRESQKNIADKIIGNRTPTTKGKIRDSEDFKYYGITKTQAGHAHSTYGMDLILQNGDRVTVDYHDLQPPRKINSGGTTIELKASPTLLITIEGKDLLDIYHYITERRLIWLKAPDNSFGEVVNDNEPVVTSIKIEETG